MPQNVATPKNHSARCFISPPRPRPRDHFSRALSFSTLPRSQPPRRIAAGTPPLRAWSFFDPSPSILSTLDDSQGPEKSVTSVVQAIYSTLEPLRLRTLLMFLSPLGGC